MGRDAMSQPGSDPIRERLEAYVGKPLGAAGPAIAPDEVNVPMIRHWVDLDPERAARSRFGGIVAPPAMLQTWTMPRPKIEGIAERGGAPDDMKYDNPISALDEEGYLGTLATNSELEFERYLRPGDRIQSATVLESISERKNTGLGRGYFVTWVTHYSVGSDEPAGRQTFRILKFDPSTMGDAAGSGRSSSHRTSAAPSGEQLPDFDLDVTSTVIVAGAIASRDFMPVHHDAEYARKQGASDVFMNILTTNGYVARYVTDWAGPEAMLRRITIRLGGPAVPGKTLRFSGRVATSSQEGELRRLEVAVRAANDLGNHASGTVELTLP